MIENIKTQKLFDKNSCVWIIAENSAKQINKRYVRGALKSNVQLFLLLNFHPLLIKRMELRKFIQVNDEKVCKATYELIFLRVKNGKSIEKCIKKLAP